MHSPKKPEGRRHAECDLGYDVPEIGIIVKASLLLVATVGSASTRYF